MTALREELSLQLPMAPGMELEASRSASAFAAGIAMSADKIDAISMAVIEAFINASEHSNSKDRTVYLTFTALGGDEQDKLRITVQDKGSGFSPEQVEKPRIEEKLKAMRKRGWGLKIIEGLMDEVEIRSDAEGTTIIMSKLR